MDTDRCEQAGGRVQLWTSDTPFLQQPMLFERIYLLVPPRDRLLS